MHRPHQERHQNRRLPANCVDQGHELGRRDAPEICGKILAVVEPTAAASQSVCLAAPSSRSGERGCGGDYSTPLYSRLGARKRGGARSVHAVSALMTGAALEWSPRPHSNRALGATGSNTQSRPPPGWRAPPGNSRATAQRTHQWTSIWWAHCNWLLAGLRQQDDRDQRGRHGHCEAVTHRARAHQEFWRIWYEKSNRR